MKSLGFVIPTRNARPGLEFHLSALARWQDLAAQIVVVDSDSQDGTLAYLKEQLRHPNVSFLEHPPGLYQSWNFGLQHLATDYAYVATVGDTITREGIVHLMMCAEAFEAGVVFSKPTFMADATHPAPDIRWPIDDLIETLAVTQPRGLSWLEVLLFTALRLDGTLLGSSASNLYRTDTLKKFPFPSEFGKAGDAAWGILHFADVKWAVTPEKFSTFLRHPDLTAAAERRNWATSTRLDKVLREAVESACAHQSIDRAAVEKHGIPPLLDAATRWMDAKESFDQSRARPWPWYLNPTAWANRARRNRERARLSLCHQKAMSGVKPNNVP